MKRDVYISPGPGRWVSSYAGFMTLLFAFFVVMYALSLQDVAKAKAASASVRQAFGVPLEKAPSVAAQTSHFASSESELQQMEELLHETLVASSEIPQVTDKVQIEQEKQGLVVRIAAEGLFSPGEREAKEDFRPLLDRIGKVVASTQRRVRVEGYTDASEELGAGGWELSAGRASWLAKYWIGKFNLPSARLSVAGFSHFRPLESEKSDWGRGKNRRVEIVIESDLPVVSEGNESHPGR
ncbi:flagellar motor protein MotB [Bdellovibrionota bacterium FG-1]